MDWNLTLSRLSVSRTLRRLLLVLWMTVVGVRSSAQQPPAERPPPPQPPTAESAPQRPPQAAPERTLLGARSAILRRDRPTLRLPSGSRIYAEPDARSQVVLRLDVDTEVELVDTPEGRASGSLRPAGWRAVRVGSVRGWTPPAGSAHEVGGDFWSQSTPAERKLRLERLERLRQRFGESSLLGPFELFSDVGADGTGGEELLQRLSPVAADVERAYQERYGLALPHEARDLAVVMFAASESYRDYVAVELGLDDPESSGVSPPGLAVFFVGERPFADVAAVLAHEMVHVFNRELFGEELPQWLEEGMAEDLSYHPIDAAGRLELGTLPQVERSLERRIGAQGRVIVERTRYTPPSLYAMACAVAAWPGRRGPDLEALSELTAVQFSEPEGRKRRYAESALLIRYLLDGGGGDRRSRFVDLLNVTAETRIFEPARWQRELGLPSAELSRDLGRWARRQVSSQLCQR